MNTQTLGKYSYSGNDLQKQKEVALMLILSHQFKMTKINIKKHFLKKEILDM